MRWCISGLLALSVVAGALPAHAWWDFAKWGLTADQAIKASRSRAAPCAPDTPACKPNFTDYKPSLFVPDLQIAGFPATAQLAFDAQGRLNATYIAFVGANFAQLNDALLGLYGQPVQVDNSWPPTRVWRDAAKGTAVKIWHFPDSRKIIIEYKPIAKGL